MSETRDLGFIHRFEPGADPSKPPILLLHGTGGDEDDLLPFGRAVAPGSALLSPRGKALENGMARFFRRFAEGKFDEDDVRFRAGELADFIDAARAAYQIAAPIAIGYSNGANVAAAILMLRPAALAGAVLMRAMAPFRQPPKVDLTGKPALMIQGAGDRIIPADSAALLAATLAEAGAAFKQELVPMGHQLSERDVALAREWIARL
jgi:phospholipase/carboxylesterase